MIPSMRSRDSQGAGYYGASRGARKHMGVDFVAKPGAEVHHLPTAKAGTVTKLGFPYRHDLSFRYVEVTCDEGYKQRYFYVDPRVSVDDWVEPGDLLGVCQELPYEGITQHYHFEVVTGSRPKVYHDPIKFLSGDVSA